MLFEKYRFHRKEAKLGFYYGKNKNRGGILKVKVLLEVLLFEWVRAFSMIIPLLGDNYILYLKRIRTPQPPQT